MAWTDEMVNQLREMWKEGLTTGEIGKRLGVSKNSIVGKVHRLGLSGRPSPIKKKEDNNSTTTPAQPVAEVEKKTTTKEKTEKKVTKTQVAPKEEKEEVVETIKPQELNKSKHHHGKTMLTDLDNHTCRWPIGDPKDENFHFCGKKVRLGQTYCDEHANIAYVKASKK